MDIIYSGDGKDLTRPVESRQGAQEPDTTSFPYIWVKRYHVAGPKRNSEGNTLLIRVSGPEVT